MDQLKLKPPQMKLANFDNHQDAEEAFCSWVQSFRLSLINIFISCSMAAEDEPIRTV